jgi:hypothetical protein
MIYFRLVNPQTARMNINIDYRTYHELELMFKECHYEPFDDDRSSMSKSSSCYTENVVAPWTDYERPKSANSRLSDEGKLIHDEIDKLYPLPVTEIHAKSTTSDGPAKNTEMDIPINFSIEVFDRAYEAVKNDVYLNTWVRYEARYSRPRCPSHARSASFIGRV